MDANRAPSGEAKRRPPRVATYRLQLHAGFRFDAAAGIADYLAALGVSHLYASPVLQAVKGSTHGYDVVDHGRLNEELGGEAAHARMSAALRAHGLAQLLDIVPNHMAVGDRRNRWWWDVLRRGPSSRYAAYFDVDWDPPESKLRNQILVPILGDHYGKVLEAGELSLAREDGEVVVRYHDHVLPISPDSLAGDSRSEAASAGAVASAADEMIRACNADPRALHELLDRQHYRLAFWRTAARDLVYRRFFDITTLAAIRVEREEVFADTHALVLRLVADGTLDGLRVDHPDGLADPEAYLARLKDATGGAWVVVEKILESGESLPETWATSGTTGYDFCARVAGLFVDALGEMPITTAYRRFTGIEAEFAEIAYEKKHQVMRDVLAADVNRLTELAVRVCDRHPRYRDYGRDELNDALRELLACLAVYRTYVRPSAGPARAEDEQRLADAVAEATRRRPELDPELVGFLREVLLGRVPGELEAEFVIRFQQSSGPIMAKGVEDTAFYNYLRMIALNEVGGSPARFGTSVEEFHEANGVAAERWPEGLTATSTHDTKRGEDVRVRIALLSEIPEAWNEAVTCWHEHTGAYRHADVDPNTEWLFYQTLVGAWPLPVERAVAYVEKATKEAKAQTSWTEPNAAYDEAVKSFVTAALADDSFVAEVAAFVAPLVRPGRVNSLAQTLLKLFSPGIADLYQGCELWDDSLVDPDNRRPVDYALRRRLLAALPPEGRAAEVWANVDEGSAKLLVVSRGLATRRRVGPLAAYRPLWAAGPAAGHVVAFTRDSRVVALVPRLILGLERRGGWGETTLALPPGRWRDAFGGMRCEGTVALGELLASFPVGLLERS